jgi:hypothetical protein
MRAATLLVAIVLAAGVLWLAGEEHRKNCLSSGRTSCSVLPWDSGRAASSPKAKRGTLTPAGCQQLLLRNLTATSTDQIEPRPPECR